MKFLDRYTSLISLLVVTFGMFATPILLWWLEPTVLWATVLIVFTWPVLALAWFFWLLAHRKAQHEEKVKLELSRWVS